MAIRKAADKKKTVKDDRSGKGDGNSDGKKHSWLHKLVLWVCIVLFVCLIAGIVFLLCQIPNGLMLKNPRMALYQIEVRSSNNYWHENKSRLWQICNLKTGQSLFSVDVGDVRRRLLALSSIEDASVQLSLPDMLIVDLSERVPVAVIGEDTFVDKNGICFKKEESSYSKQKKLFPVISGNVESGGNLSNNREVCAVLQLLAVADNHSNIKIHEVKIENRDLLIVKLTDQSSNRDFIFKFPTGKDFSSLFNRVNNILFDVSNRGENSSEFDLRYDNAAAY